jgi:hypothetical protein
MGLTEILHRNSTHLAAKRRSADPPTSRSSPSARKAAPPTRSRTEAGGRRSRSAASGRIKILTMKSPGHRTPAFVAGQATPFAALAPLPAALAQRRVLPRRTPPRHRRDGDRRLPRDVARQVLGEAGRWTQRRADGFCARLGGTRAQSRSQVEALDRGRGRARFCARGGPDDRVFRPQYARPR